MSAALKPTAVLARAKRLPGQPAPRVYLRLVDLIAEDETGTPVHRLRVRSIEIEARGGDASTIEASIAALLERTVGK